MTELNLIPIETLMEFKENDKEFALIEVLSEDQYEKEHIPGAINIPEEKIESRAPKKFDKDYPIVVYCASYSCHSSTNAARKLTEMGYENIYDFKAGKRGWQHAGLKLKS
ncbi:MAG: rhodanese-like domain-containing protein [Candidatus Lokiarchaeota archaeon]|nr:rhodanese-like domain-containing protein [Candidatus Lokiarchaeota archaeon]